MSTLKSGRSAVGAAAGFREHTIPGSRLGFTAQANIAFHPFAGIELLLDLPGKEKTLTYPLPGYNKSLSKYAFKSRPCHLVEVECVADYRRPLPLSFTCWRQLYFIYLVFLPLPEFWVFPYAVLNSTFASLKFKMEVNKLLHGVKLPGVSREWDHGAQGRGTVAIALFHK